MERYTNFRDKATGISPFLPVTQTNIIGISDSPIQSFIKKSKLDIIAKSLLYLIRVALILPLLVITVLLSVILGSHPVSYLYRVILFIAGLISYEFTVQNLKTKNLNRQTFYPSKNDIYFVNFSSPLDVLILLVISNDDFALLLPNKKGDLQLLGKWEIIKKSLIGYVPNNDTEVPLDFSSLKNKIIYIFPEGTTSNGKSILPFLLKQEKFDDFFAKFSTDRKTHKVKSLGIKVYPSTLVTPLRYSVLGYSFKLLTTISFNLKLRVNTINELNPSDTSLQKIRSSFTNNGKFRLVNEDLNVDAKFKFIETYIGRK